MKSLLENRISAVRRSLEPNHIDTLMVLIEENRRYLSGFTGEDTQFDESAGALFISETELVLATDSRFDLQAANEAPLYQIFCYKEGLIKSLPELLNRLRTRRLGFESVRLSYSQYQKIAEQLTTHNVRVDLVETQDVVEKLRLVKDESEIHATRKALEIAESVFKNFIHTITPGMTEKEAAWSMEKGMREAGAEALSFATIVASGPNSALPHAIPANRKFKTNEPILFDWGARLNGYCSDISRTVVMGRPDTTFKKVYQTVMDAQQKAIEAIKPGMSSRAIDQIARNHIEQMGFKDKFGHGLGHGTGLAVHEAPRLSPLKDSLLEPGMIFTVEPGIYLPDWGGIRLENMAVVREDGVEVLNTLDLIDYII